MKPFRTCVLILGLLVSLESSAPLPSWCAPYLSALSEERAADKLMTWEQGRRGNYGMVLVVEPEVGKHFDAHGISKGPDDHLDQVIKLLSEGIDETRGFHSGPLRGAEGTPIAPFTLTASFVVLGHPDKPLGAGIGYVVVADNYLHVLPKLSVLFPGTKFMSSEDAPAVLAAAVRASDPNAEVSAAALNAADPFPSMGNPGVPKSQDLPSRSEKPPRLENLMVVP